MNSLKDDAKRKAFRERCKVRAKANPELLKALRIQQWDMIRESIAKL